MVGQYAKVPAPAEFSPLVEPTSEPAYTPIKGAGEIQHGIPEQKRQIIYLVEVLSVRYWPVVAPFIYFGDNCSGRNFGAKNSSAWSISTSLFLLLCNGNSESFQPRRPVLRETTFS